MAEEIENMDMATDGVNSKDQEPSEELDARTENDETEGESKDLNPDLANKRKGFAGFVLRNKFILLSVLIIIFVTAGLSYKFGPVLQDQLFKENNVIDLSLINEANLKEEILLPFIIPLPPDSIGSAVRIDFSVIWDGLASVRFEKNELHIRDKLYKDIVRLANESEDQTIKSDFLEKKMTTIFRELLSVQNLVIKIKEIKYF